MTVKNVKRRAGDLLFESLFTIQLHSGQKEDKKRFVGTGWKKREIVVGKIGMPKRRKISSEQLPQSIFFNFFHSDFGHRVKNPYFLCFFLGVGTQSSRRFSDMQFNPEKKRLQRFRLLALQGTQQMYRLRIISSIPTKFSWMAWTSCNMGHFICSFQNDQNRWNFSLAKRK